MQLKLNDNDKEIIVKNRQLKDYAYDLLKRQQEIIREKAFLQQEREQRIKQSNNRYQIWSEKKNNQYLSKAQKSQKNKMEHLSKIVKKCQQKNKLVQKKNKEYRLKKNRSLNEAWVKSEQLTNDIMMEINRSKKHSKHKEHHTTEGDKQTKSIMIGNVEIDEKPKTKMNNSVNIINPSHFQKGNMNFSTMFHFTQYIQNNQKHFDEQSVNSEEYMTRTQRNQRNLKKLQQVRRRQVLQQQEKIQKLGQKLNKIEKSRIKKIELNSKKKSHTESGHQQKQRNYQSLEKNIKLNGTQKKCALTSTNFRQKRVRNYETHNKQKRIEAFENHLENGNHYLKKLKVKNLKTILAKNIAYNAMEKKLYYDRLKN